MTLTKPGVERESRRVCRADRVSRVGSAVRTMLIFDVRAGLFKMPAARWELRIHAALRQRLDVDFPVRIDADVGGDLQSLFDDRFG